MTRDEGRMPLFSMTRETSAIIADQVAPFVICDEASWLEWLSVHETAGALYRGQSLSGKGMSFPLACSLDRPDSRSAGACASRVIRSLCTERAMQKCAWLALLNARHEGDAVPALDWSTSPDVALFFALDGAIKGAPAVEIVVWHPAKHEILDIDADIHRRAMSPLEVPQVKVYMPPVSVCRRADAQEGCLTVHGPRSDADRFWRVCDADAVSTPPTRHRVDASSVAKDQLLRMLARRNVCRGSLGLTEQRGFRLA